MNSTSPIEKSIAKSVVARISTRSGAWTGHTSGLAEGHGQGNVFILPELLANDFLRFCQLATAVGAQPVTIQLAELPAALATGGADNFLTSTSSGIDSKLYESVKFFYDVNAWLPRNAVVVNQKAFDALDRAGQDAVLQQAAVAEARGWQNSEKNNADNLKELAAKGMKIDTVVGESLKKELKPIGETMTADWLKLAGADGKAIIDAYKK